MKKKLVLKRETIRSLDGSQRLMTPEMARVEGGSSHICSAVGSAISVEVVNETLSDPIGHFARWIDKKISKAICVSYNGTCDPAACHN